MLTAKQKEVLEALYNGNIPERHQDHIPELLKNAYVVEADGSYQLTDKALTNLNLASSFGAAVADVLLPGAGSGTGKTSR